MSNWNEAMAAAQTLNGSTDLLNTAELKPDLVAQLASRTADLQGSLKAQQRIESMDAANSVTRLVDELSSSYEPEIPYEIVLLDYFGRQIEIPADFVAPVRAELEAVDRLEKIFTP